MMSRITNSVCWLAMVLSPCIAHAQHTDLPRVLILGDAVYRQPAQEAKKQLQGKVEVVYVTMSAGEVLNTSSALAKLDTLLGEEPWDLIHFNFGLGDLIYRVPTTKSFRALPIHVGGVRATSPQQYEANLQKLAKRLRATDAKLVWAHTTPIRHSSSNVFQLGSEIEYNAIAARVMYDHKVPVNDMYSYVKTLIDMKKPASHGADPFFFDRKPLHPPVVESILRELGVE